MKKNFLVLVLACICLAANAQFEGIQRDTFFTKGDTLKFVDALGSVRFDNPPFFVAVKPLHPKPFKNPQYFINNQPVSLIVWNGYYFTSSKSD
jgi:hypothetical protein